jgi:hypothetical protein
MPIRNADTYNHCPVLRNLSKSVGIALHIYTLASAMDSKNFKNLKFSDRLDCELPDSSSWRTFFHTNESSGIINEMGPGVCPAKNDRCALPAWMTLSTHFDYFDPNLRRLMAVRDRKASTSPEDTPSTLSSFAHPHVRNARGMN